ncbi:MAG: hypothetical protein IT198_05945 [Acidimicrobiia bacterium]|nr:hypothetical protein [Acidimicrobiia bacterium]
MDAATDDLVRLDAAVRRQDASLADIDGVADVLGGDDAPDELRWWVAAIRAEYLLWKGDLHAMAVATTTLAQMPEDPLPPARVLVSRGRLRGVAALGHLFLSSPERGRTELEAAVADLARAGAEEERALASGLFAVARAGFFLDDFEWCEGILAESTDCVRVSGSPLLGLVACGLAFVRFLTGDMYGMHAALRHVDDAVDSSGGAGLGATVARYLRAMARLIGESASPAAVAAVEAVGQEIRLRYPTAVASTANAVSAVLLDFDRRDAARSWVSRQEMLPTANPLGGFDSRVLALRLRVREGDDGAVGELLSVLDEMHAAGQTRDAALKALRAAWDARRGGVDAAPLRSWGLAHVPPERKRTLWELVLSSLPVPSAEGPAHGRHPDPAESVDRMSTLRLLSHHVELAVPDGGTIRLEGNPARLLAVLVAERSVTVDRLIDRLWPDARSDVGRNRLNVTLHKLRRRLAPGAVDLVVRTGNVIELQPTPHLRVDAWEFGAEASRGAVSALDLYAAHFGGPAFAYDDCVADERRRLEALWIDLATIALDTGEVDPRRIAEDVLCLDIADTGLADKLVACLESSGNHATAVAMRAMSA